MLLQLLVDPLKARRGALICDDLAGYKAWIANGVTDVGCLAHARRKFFDLHAAHKSQIAGFALEQFAKAYDIEREKKTQRLSTQAAAHQAGAQCIAPVDDIATAKAAGQLLIFAKNMTTAKLLARYVFRLVPGEYGHGAKAIERGSEEAVARWANAAKGQGLRRGGAGRWRGTPDRVYVESIA